MTIEQILDTYRKEHAAGRFPAHGEDGEIKCLYRGTSDTRCAIGVFIPDDMYDPALESNSFTDLLSDGDTEYIIDCIPEIDGMPYYRRHFWNDVQELHDAYSPSSVFAFPEPDGLFNIEYFCVRVREIFDMYSKGEE